MVKSGYVLPKAKEHDDEIPDSIEDYITEKSVECISVKSLFSNFEINDFILAIDVEGFDFEVFKMFIFERRLPKLLIIEYCHLNSNDLKDLKSVLYKENYKYKGFSRDIVATLKYEKGD